MRWLGKGFVDNSWRWASTSCSSVEIVDEPVYGSQRRRGQVLSSAVCVAMAAEICCPKCNHRQQHSRFRRDAQVCHQGRACLH